MSEPQRSTPSLLRTVRNSRALNEDRNNADNNNNKDKDRDNNNNKNFGNDNNSDNNQGKSDKTPTITAKTAVTAAISLHPTTSPQRPILSPKPASYRHRTFSFPEL